MLIDRSPVNLAIFYLKEMMDMVEMLKSIMSPDYKEDVEDMSIDYYSSPQGQPLRLLKSLLYGR